MAVQKSGVRRAFVAVSVLMFVLCLATTTHAAVLTQIIPNEWEAYAEAQLDWSDSDDDWNSGSTPLGFSVTLGGATYDYFDMNSNGYVELLTDAGDAPFDWGYDYVAGLISANASSTYLLAGYDDLTSEYYNFFGYKLLSDRAVFYYDTETWDDEDMDYTNVYEVILFDDGRVQWNFQSADYSSYGYDLFSGLYFGNTGTLVELISGDIPESESYLYQVPVPEPVTLLVMAAAGLPVLLKRKRKSRA